MNNARDRAIFLKTYVLEKSVATVTILAFGLYVLSDLLELFYGGLTPIQLIITYVAMLMIPFSMMGLYSMHFRVGGVLLLMGTGLIAISFIYFSGTAIYAFTEKVLDYSVLVEKLGVTYLFHGILLVAGGLIFSLSIFSKRLFSKWVLSLILAASLISLCTGYFQLPERGYVIANFFRNIGFLCIGLSLLQDKSLATGG